MLGNIPELIKIVKQVGAKTFLTTIFGGNLNFNNDKNAERIKSING